jgi:hypothetical protein
MNIEYVIIASTFALIAVICATATVTHFRSRFNRFDVE